MKIDNLNAQYEIPGFEIAPKAFEPEEVEEDFRDAPYSLNAGVASIPSPGGWQQLLGLTEVSPTPISIDPPIRPAAGEWKTKATASYRVHRDTGGDTPSPTSSINVKRMLSMLTQTRKNVARIRARAMEGA
jgi:hypothetical protein